MQDLGETVMQEMADAPQTERMPQEFRPSNNSALKEWHLQIEFLDRGCLVVVGCKRIAFESVEDAMKAVNTYVANPWDEQQRWRKLLDM
jgi:hypothetical protein